MLDTLTHLLRGLLNLPDLLLLAVILISAGLGASRGLVRTLTNGFGRILALAGASAAASFAAPALARFLVTPIVGDIFQVRAADLLSRTPGLAENLQIKATAMAAEMTGSLAFFLLFFIFLLIMNILVHTAGTALHLATRIGPVGFVNRLAGAALGGILGLVLCLLGLLAMTFFSPGMLGPLGYLSPERLAETSLTAHLLGLLPRF